MAKKAIKGGRAPNTVTALIGNTLRTKGGGLPREMRRQEQISAGAGSREQGAESRGKRE